MKKRFTFKCWSCERTYTLFKEITKEQVLIVPCPYCKADAIVELPLYVKEKKTVLRKDRYITNEKGMPKYVILPIREYHKMLSLLEDYGLSKAIKEVKKEKIHSLDEALKLLND